MQKRKFRLPVKKRYIIIVFVILLLIVLRLMLPYIVLRYSNNKLAHIHGYYGHVQDIDIALYRGAYQVKDMYLNKLDSATQKQTPFFKVQKVDLSVQWKSLFHGRLVGELTFYSPAIIFTKNKTEIGDVKKDTGSFRMVLKDFMPLKVNHFEIDDGTVHYVDAGAKPAVDVSLKQVHAIAQNLSNAEDTKAELPSPITATGNAYGGKLSLNMRINLLAEKTAFDLNAQVTNANLALLNNFLKAYGGFDVNRGTLGLYTEFAAKDGRYVGYVKPVIKDLKVLGPQDSSDNLLQKAWEVIVGGAADILKNQKKNQIASKVPIQGEFGKSHTNIIEAIIEVLRNAFVQALMPDIDNQININSVNTAVKPEHKTFLQRVFGGGKRSKKTKKK